MTIVRARTMGFCPGVRRAVATAESAAAAARASGKRGFVLGQIVHNPRVSARLEELGMRRLEESDLSSGRPGPRSGRDDGRPDTTQAPGSGSPGARGAELTDAGRPSPVSAPSVGEPGEPPGALSDAVVVIRSHGAAPAVFERLKAAGAEIVDATCPRVAANQKAAASYAARGFLVVIAGDEGHGETLGVAGHAPGSVVVSSPSAARAVPTGRPVAIIAQTTISEAEYSAIRDALAEGRPDLADSGGVCGCSRDRRSALEALRGRVDAVVVVGGKNSANTRRLAELAVSLGLPTWHVESAAEIPDQLGAFGTVGLSAGASTPDADVDEAEARLLELASLGGRPA